MPDLSRLWTPRPSLLADAFARAGHELRLVGGPVRCALAGEVPKDEDLCSDARPEEMLLLAARLGLRTIPALAEVERDPGEWDKGGLRHGTVPFVVDGEVLEVTTLRVDTETDGRHAKVEFVRDFRADAARRDLTFNAMSVDRAGRLHDPFGGAEDLRRGLARFVGDADARIREDYLRILRYYRFRGRYALQSPGPEARRLDDATAAAVSRNAPGLARISGERIWQEISRILAAPWGARQVADMAASGAAPVIGLPAGSSGLAAAERAARSGAPAAVALGFLLHGSGTSAEDIQARWRLGHEEAALAGLAAANAGLSTAPFSEFLAMATEPRARRDRLASLLRGFGRAGEADRLLGALPEFPLRGADLVAAGAVPGPEIGRRLTALRAMWRGSGYAASAEQLLSAEAEPGRAPRP